MLLTISSTALLTTSMALLVHAQNLPGPTAVARRAAGNHAAQVECVVTHLGDNVAMPEPSNSEISDSAMAGEVCEATLPATLSSDYNSYREELTEWAENLKDVIAGLTSCGIDSTTIPLGVGEHCPTGVVIFYTGSSETVTSHYGILPNPTEIVRPVPEETKTGLACHSVGSFGIWVAVVVMLFTIIN